MLIMEVEVIVMDALFKSAYNKLNGLSIAEVLSRGRSDFFGCSMRLLKVVMFGLVVVEWHER